MSRSKFMVIKLSDLKLPLIMLGIALAAFTYLLLNSSDSTQTFAPSEAYEDGMYIANMAFSDANMDIIVSVVDEEITSIALDGFDATEKSLYQDLQNSLTFINDYITSTQSLELPETSNVSASTSILLDAVKVALSDQSNYMITSTYQTPLLQNLSEEVAAQAESPIEDITTSSESDEPTTDVDTTSDETQDSIATSSSVVEK